MDLSDISTQLAFAVLAAVTAAVVHAMRQRDAKKRMALVESGRVCLNCDSFEVVDAPTGVRCEACGYVTSDALRRAQVSSADIAAVTDPRTRHD